ncbi:MAG: (d)CMP kinase [Candidatus Eisenbacteria bacterium]|uniref:Cytidylate kinase n=1 Tax=Eiseniibacteriota bacterium TaxID=2212470 RepID=A0A948RVD7_UNCEI|nr:(d)CMP kinase [Candidatus Eisenbacteria bacterium]MBU1947159.1 (d)CMP kinase [Candidatus Eisenbacteria bacterium]MBU2691221.1 (d)CMP kinase [Candidatus Eisenbacteria bacterium]
MTPDIIAIDGPAGTGKTTSAAGVAHELGFAYIDSGAVYRAIAVAAVDAGIENLPDPRVDALLTQVTVTADTSAGLFRVFVNGDEVTARLREPRVSNLSSVLAVRVDVREKVDRVLHRLAESQSVVIEGRDIGTVVFPDAILKIFLTADRRERAQRRLKDLEKLGSAPSVDEVEEEIAERDSRDSGRAVAPLKRHPDAIVIDTTAMTPAEQIQCIVQAYRRRRAPGGL